MMSFRGYATFDDFYQSCLAQAERKSLFKKLQLALAHRIAVLEAMEEIYNSRIKHFKLGIKTLIEEEGVHDAYN